MQYPFCQFVGKAIKKPGGWPGLLSLARVIPDGSVMTFDFLLVLQYLTVKFVSEQINGRIHIRRFRIGEQVSAGDLDSGMLVMLSKWRSTFSSLVCTYSLRASVSST